MPCVEVTVRGEMGLRFDVGCLARSLRSHAGPALPATSSGKDSDNSYDELIGNTKSTDRRCPAQTPYSGDKAVLLCGVHFTNERLGLVCCRAATCSTRIGYLNPSRALMSLVAAAEPKGEHNSQHQREPHDFH